MIAKYLAIGDVISINHPREVVEQVARKVGHLIVTTDYTRTTGGTAYQLDYLQAINTPEIPNHFGGDSYQD